MDFYICEICGKRFTSLTGICPKCKHDNWEEPEKTDEKKNKKEDDDE